MRIILAALAVLFAVDAGAQMIDAPKEYRNCFILARQKPEEGWEQAIAWQSLGGGEPARHCAAVALIALGKYEEAAQRLETLAGESRRVEAVRAEMLAQAGQAWLLAGRPERALAAQDTALQLMPGQPDLLLDKAVTLAQAHHYKEAVAVLSDVLKRQPNRVEAMVLRASAHRYLDQAALAKDDVARALVLDPEFPDALLERGMLRRLDDDRLGARQDWLKVLELSAPDAPAADAARNNIEMMDVRK
jgi:tetratricopeptide (TPR) repeat protein